MYLYIDCVCVDSNETQIHASTMNHDPTNVIRVGTDLRFVDFSRPWDKVGITRNPFLTIADSIQRWDKDYTFNDGV